MKFVRALELFEEAQHVPEVRAAVLRRRHELLTPLMVACLMREVREKVVSHFDGSEEGRDLAKAIVLVRHRRKPGLVALALDEALLPNGEDEDGDWERVKENDR